MVQSVKYDIVTHLKERFSGAKAIVLVDYKGINVEQVNQLRRRFRAENVDYFVQKNTLIKLALNDLGITELDAHLIGPTAIAVCHEDEVAPTRVLVKFNKEVMDNAGFPSFKAGYVAGALLDAKQLTALAAMPSRDELLAKILGSAQAPITNFLSISQGIIRKFIYAVQAIRDKDTEAS
ncbi:MAG TPA: 50S ribosomal protein L10 [Candidatus Cloacimonetes bacterium]|jgi:large subunit ribosomal protein L10|nr:50S ribosomal protein L10 [Candidatus Cloacimonas sp.]HHZ16005.1 50S ribosomal protein L10 [Candidatus Cloacimonadota bacterium]